MSIDREYQTERTPYSRFAFDRDLTLMGLHDVFHQTQEFLLLVHQSI